jgi:mannose-6-phosphate isomerase-like protein (cupin superfamily)
MADDTQSKINKLLDQLEAGKITVADFARRASKMGIGTEGLGTHVATTEAEAPIARGLVRTGVLVKVEEQDDQSTRVEGTVKPGAVEFDQIITKEWQVESTDRPLAVDVAGRGAVTPVGVAVEVKARQPLRFKNPGKRTIKFVARQPVWDPKDYSYRYRDRRIAGAEMWFELKTSDVDRVPRPMYNVVSAGGQGNFVVITVEPNTETVRSYYTDDRYVITGLVGTGAVEVTRGRSRPKSTTIQRGTTVTLQPNDVFRLINTTRSDFMVEVRSVSARYWTPDSTYFETKKGKFVPGNQIYFEFVIPG